MTRQVTIAGAVRVNETELAVLELVASRAGAPGGAAELGVAEVAEAAGVSAPTARRSLRSLEEAGLVRISARTAADGGRLANAYSLTPTGSLAAAAARADGLAPG